MSKGRSYKNDTFSSFEKQSYSLISDDFVHSKLITVKANIPSTNGGVNLKESLSTKGQEVSTSGEAKLWFYLNKNSSIYAKVLPQCLNVQYDHGIVDWKNKLINPYASFSFNRTLRDLAVRVGGEVYNSEGTWSCNNALQYTQNDKGSNVQLFHKAYSLHDQKKCIFNNYTTLNLTKKTVEQIALLAGYRGWGSVSNDIYLRWELDGFSNSKELEKSLWEKNTLTIDWINGKKGNFTHGFEVFYKQLLSQVSSSLKDIINCPCSLLKNFSTAFEINAPENNSVFKLKLASNWSAAVSLKHKIGSYGSYTWGAQLSNIGTKNNIKFGVQFDLNV